MSKVNRLKGNGRKGNMRIKNNHGLINNFFLRYLPNISTNFGKDELKMVTNFTVLPNIYPGDKPLI
jgi:hypothetical protein